MTSMDRLTLNVLLSFAQFEREVIGERIRDKFAASRCKGLWMGGNVPLGYRVEARKLVMVETEAELARKMFARFAKVAEGEVPASNILLLRVNGLAQSSCWRALRQFWSIA